MSKRGLGTGIRFSFSGGHGLSAHSVLVLFIYMSLIYSCVSVFACAVTGSDVTTLYLDGWIESSSADPDLNTYNGHIGDLEGGWETGTNDLPVLNEETIDGSMDWWNSIQTFFDTIIKGFTFLINFLSFGIVCPVAFPWWLSWIPFMLVLPVWLAVIYMLLPHAIAMINAIGNLIPFT